MNVKAIIASLVLGSSSAAMAAPRVTHAASVRGPRKPGPARAALQLTGAAYAHTSNVVTTLTSEITLEAWVRRHGGTAAQAVLYNGNSATSGYGIYLRNGGVSLLSGGIDWADCMTCTIVPRRLDPPRGGAEQQPVDDLPGHDRPDCRERDATVHAAGRHVLDRE